MRTRALILAGGEGTRLGVLTAKRTKPAVPFGGKYRIIDFPLSNCINSNIYDVMIIAQYRPHSLIEHIGAGGPWDLNRDFSGGVRIYTPYRSKGSGWFVGTADAVQQNFSFIKRNNPDLILILSGDHIYNMNYEEMIRFHVEQKAQLTIATLEVPWEEASRFGIVDISPDLRVTSFVEKPKDPPSNVANMGVYLFNLDLLDQVLWEDHLRQDSSHDFGKDILPKLVKSDVRVCAYRYSGYWVDVGTVSSYWQAHMDLLEPKPALNLFDRSWVVHTRSEEMPPSYVHSGSIVERSLVSNGCIIEPGARVVRSVLSPGVIVRKDSVIQDSIILTAASIGEGCRISRSVIDKKVQLGAACQVGSMDGELNISMIGRNSILPPGLVIEAGGIIGPEVIPSDITAEIIRGGEYVQTRRLPYEV